MFNSALIYFVCGASPIQPGPFCPLVTLFFHQLSIEEFLINPVDPKDQDHKLLLNPLSAEFGVKTAEDMDRLIKGKLPDFKLVRLCLTSGAPAKT